MALSPTRYRRRPLYPEDQSGAGPLPAPTLTDEVVAPSEETPEGADGNQAGDLVWADSPAVPYYPTAENAALPLAATGAATAAGAAPMRSSVTAVEPRPQARLSVFATPPPQVAGDATAPSGPAASSTTTVPPRGATTPIRPAASMATTVPPRRAATNFQLAVARSVAKPPRVNRRGASSGTARKKHAKGGAKKASARPSSGPRGPGFSTYELEVFLDILEKHVPIGGDEWDAVCREHCAEIGEDRRTVDSLRRKFTTLYRTKVPTGDPKCPLAVKQAKRVRQLIVERSEISDCEDGDGEIERVFGSDGESNDSSDDNEDTTTAFGASTVTVGTGGTQPPVARPLASAHAAETVVRHRGRKPDKKSEAASDLMMMLKMQMIEDSKRRSTEDERRVREREEARQERAEEAKRRADEREETRRERERSDDMMKMMLLALANRKE